MTATHEQLWQHRRGVTLRTAGSAVLYGGFLVTSVLSAVQNLSLEDPLTLVSIGFIVAAFMALPRDYVPVRLLRKASSEEEEAEVSALRRLERAGLYLRVFYVLGAVVTIPVLPRLVV
jgi:hypothetical protein